MIKQKSYSWSEWWYLLLIILLFAIYPVIFLLAHNWYRFTLSVAVLPVLTSAVIAVVLWILLALCIRHPERAACIVVVNTAFFYSYGMFTLFIKAVEPLMILGYNNLYFIAFLFLNTALIFVLRKYHTIAETANRILFIIISTSLILSLLTITVSSRKRYHAALTRSSDDSRLEMLLKQVGFSNDTIKKPDIYHIILDAHPRSDMLTKYFGADNSRFITFLESSGFIVAHNGLSNYSCTDLSIPATLNFTYMHDTNDSLHRSPLVLSELRYRKTHSLAKKFLNQLGYSTYTIRNGFETDERSTFDHFIQPHTILPGLSLNEFNYGVLRMTPLMAIINRFDYLGHSFFGEHRRLIRSALDFLSYAHLEKKTKYVFAHIIAPHIPIVFGRHGEELKDNKPYLNDPSADPDAFIQASKDEIFFLDSIVMQTIANMIRKDSNCVIILQSDHGELPVWPEEPCPQKSVIEQRHGILYAMRIPGKLPDLSKKATAVNTYPLLFNAIFGCKIPLKKDRVFYSRYASTEYFCEVTDSLGL